MVASELVRRASPDGYSMLLNGSSLWLSPLMRDNVAYDPIKDYAPVTMVASAPSAADSVGVAMPPDMAPTTTTKIDTSGST